MRRATIAALVTYGLLSAAGCSTAGQGGDGGLFGGDGSASAGDPSAGGTSADDGADDDDDAGQTGDGGADGTAGGDGPDGDGGANEAGADDQDDDPGDDQGDDQGSGDGDTDGLSTGDGGSGDDAAEAGDDDAGAAGPADPCGFDSDGVWVQFEYDQAGGTATSPDWGYSDTPGWGESQWAAQGESWPEVWDVFDNINVVNDPIGVVAAVGSSGELQLMIGLQDLVAYDYATACIEGRSVSATASVTFEAYNPLNGCGASTTMAHDWSVHAEGVDLGQCFVLGGGVQALRLEPTGGSSSLGVTRVRLTLHGASY